MIRNMLGEPDKTASNPHYRRAAPMKLYSVGRVLDAEALSSFTRHGSDSKRKEAAEGSKNEGRQVDEMGRIDPHRV